MSAPPAVETVTLRQRIEWHGQTYEKLELTEPTAGQLAEADKAGGAHDVNIKLISLVARIPMDVAKGLPATEYRQCLSYFRNFMGPVPATGGGSSQE